MVTPILVNGTGEILKRLISMATEEISLVWNVEEELEKLVRTLTAIQALLQDAEKQQEEKETVKLLLRRLRDVAYAAEDVLDEFGYQTTRLKVTNKVSKFFLHSISPAFKLKMAHEIKNINNDFDAIKRNMDLFNFGRVSVPTSTLQNTKTTIETFSFVDESEVVGRDDEKSKLVNMLISSDNQDTLSVLPVVGMGGLGKTTLAKIVYNDGLVEKYFDKRIWVHVSKDFDMKKVLTSITESVTNSTCQFSSIDVIQRNLKYELNEKRFLVVLDDIWNDGIEQWDMLKASLKIGARGSKIIVTTRLGEVASMIGTLAIHHIKSLSTDQCWSIIKNKAFGIAGAEETPNMVAIGKQIVQKCGGVPLAAKALGGLMHIKKDEQGWLSVRDSEIWTLPMGKDGILPALKLSYDNLPSPLKQCFLYCSIFPKGSSIEKNKLIGLWIALGFLQPSIGDRATEDIGNDYVNYLLWNSLFEVAQKDDVLGIMSFKMHDLVFDLACSLSRFDNISVGAEELKNKSDVLHLRLYLEGDINLKLIEEGLCKMRKLRSLHLDCTKTRTPICNNVLDILFKKLKHLRVLDLSNIMIQKLPSSIKKLKNLRSLNLCSNPLEVLPASITSLYHLQSLVLCDCPLTELPQDMRNLINLRQLIVYKKDGCLSQMPMDMGRLRFLNNLWTFVVGHKKGHSVKELQCLDLRYILNLQSLRNLRSRVEAEEANLMRKEKLLALILSWGGDSSYMLGNDKKKTVLAEEDVLEGLRPHSNLKELCIENFGGVNFPGWMMSRCESFLPNLVRLFLIKCKRLERVPPLGRLPSLKVLHLNGVKRMKRLGNELYHHEDDGSSNSHQAATAVNTTTALFPSLERLLLLQMPNLEEWVEPPHQPRQGGSIIPSFPHLKEIIVEDCPKLMIIPSQFPSLKLLRIERSNGMLLSSVAKVPSLTTLNIVEAPELKFLPKGLLHNNITKLHIEKCPKLEAIIMPSEEEGVQVHQALPSSLEILSVEDCPSLMSLPDLHGLYNITELHIEKCPKLEAIIMPSEEEGVQVHQALSSSLEILSVEDCPSLMSFPDLHGLQSIRRLYFVNNEKIARLPEGLHNLRTLEFLSIGWLSSELESFPDLEPLQHLPSLRYLVIAAWSKLTSLPHQLQWLTQLESLAIYKFRSVAALPEWLGNLSSLRGLYLEECDNLMNLPKEEGLRCFDALEYFWIKSCPLLKERCSRERGEEWPKIKHIQCIKIDGQYV